MDYTRILSDLIAIDTSMPPGNNYEKAIEYLLPLFKQVGFQAHEIIIPKAHAEGREGRYGLVCNRRQPGNLRMIFYAHVDVVPAAGWDAFKPRVENGKIYGRGAADMKGSIAALLLGLEAVKDKPLKYDTSVMVTVDEEHSQASQLRYLAQFMQPLAGSYVFSLDNSFGFVIISGLGALQMTVKVKGKSVHSGLSHLGENAIEKAVPVMQALLDLKSRLALKQSKVPAHPDTGLTYMVPRLNINKIDGGLKVNIVPDECRIAIDRRLIPEENLADAEKEIRECLASVPNVNWEIENIFRIPTLPPSEDRIIDELAEIILRVTGATGKYGEMGSGDLSNIVVNEWRGKEFGLGVIRPDCNIHGKDEFVYQKDIEDLAKVIEMFLVD